MKSMAAEKVELDKYWNDLLFRVCKGSAESINALNKFGVYDLFYYIDNAIKQK